MTSTEAVKNEIERFLKSTDPEVICITGEWGVGKTYTWQTVLDRLRGRKEIGLSRYSYVSLFGIGSLEAFKLSIFENLEFLVPQGGAGFEWMLSRGNMVLQKSKKLVSVAGALPKIGDAFSKAQPLLFTSIRSQIICIDDLERRGAISVKDVFGLISYLREQRHCKIVLLLNQTKLEENSESKQEFTDYFEKVIDAKIVFAPTSEEAVAIAIAGTDKVSKLIAEDAIKLRISNIRVLKKIERLIRMVEPIVVSMDPAIMKQAVNTLMMLGWCKFDKGA
jgi:Cdc6-like AAA superfamily ATPase